MVDRAQQAADAIAALAGASPATAKRALDEYNTDDLVAALAVSGSGSSGLSVATATLNDEQIRELQTTAVEVVAAPGSGRVLVPIVGLMTLDTAAGAYTTGDEFYVFFNWGSTLQPASGQYKETENGAFEDASVKQLGVFVVNSNPGSVVVPWLGTVEDRPLTVFAIADPVADLTDGNPANTLKVVLHYTTMETA